MVRPEKVRHLVTVLRDQLADLRRYRQRFTLPDLRTDRDAQHLVLHAMYVAAQATIDLALHVLADADEPTPTTYADAFPALAAAGRLDPALAQRLSNWARLRNVIAHHYPIIKWDLVHAALQNDLRELEAFEHLATSWLDP